jgi:DNA-directed RNA polymerase specialized sigma24 family protein
VLGWSLPEVAAATGVPLNTVRSRVRRAKNALRAAVEADLSLVEGLE